jgi:hypothetical protein
MHGCGTWSLTLREEHSWREFRRIFGRKREVVVIMGGWRRLHNEELCNLCASPNITRVIKSRKMK